MRLPRDLSGDELAVLLRRHFGYRLIRQRGSHMTLAVTDEETKHNLTIPCHRQVNVGTLSSILSDVAEHLDLPQDEVRQRLFGR